MSDIPGVAAAKQKVEAAKQKVEAAEQEVAAAKQKYMGTEDGSFQREMAAKSWEIAHAGLKGAQQQLTLLTQFDQTTAATTSSQPPEQQNTQQNFADAVFLLYCGDGNPIGTAFAISPTLMLTVCHNVVHRSDDGSVITLVTDLKVTSSMNKDPETMEISAVGPVREVEVYKYNIDVDWACLKLKDGSANFSFVIPLATNDNDLPKPATKEKMDIYHCPVQLFIDNAKLDQCHVMVKEESVGIIGAKTISFQNGSFPGSCGGPFVFRNKAIALHMDSFSTTKI